MVDKQSIQSLSDDLLLRSLAELVKDSRKIESVLVAHMAEVDRRQLYRQKSCSSMFVYCTEVLHLSEGATYMRIAAARASRDHPVLLTMLADGRLHVSTISRLAPHLTVQNRDDLLSRAVHLSKRQIEELVVELAPKPDVAASMRKLPSKTTEANPTLAVELCPGTVASSALPAPPVVRARAPKPRVEPLAPARYKVQFTASALLREKLERLETLMKSALPHADLADVIEVAVTEKLERLEAQRFGKTKSARKKLEDVETAPKGRYIPAPIRRQVSERDGDQCTFVGDDGRRCTESRWLEFHHDKPYARDGDHSLENLHLLCRAHNAYLAEKDYGKDVMAQYQRSWGVVRETVAGYLTGGDQFEVAAPRSYTILPPTMV